MTEADRSLFSRALYEAFSERIAEDISECKKITPTKRHARVVKAIIKDEKIISFRNKKIPLRLLVAAAIIAALLLSGCAATMLYRNEFASFIEEIYTDHISLIFGSEEGASSNDFIETFYELNYLPDGYKFVSEEPFYDYKYYHNYSNEAGGEIVLEQYLSSTAHINLDPGSTNVFLINGFEVYCLEAPYYTFCYWKVDNCTMELSVPSDIPLDEVKKMIENVVIKNFE